MKETGVIRRIDELGRIVIPKEIRKKLKIRNGDSIDIYIDQDKIVLQKYSALKDLDTVITILLDTLKKVYGAKIVITDMTKVIATTVKEIPLNELSEEYIKLIEKKKETDLNKSSITLNNEYILNTYSKVLPIVIYGDLFGSILIMDCTNKSIEILNLINSFISDYIET
ncbi:MAG: AbrB/MazE/SpoVT family DNA-binding domain-containing protein [Mycoplasmatota bacterium]